MMFFKPVGELACKSFVRVRHLAASAWSACLAFSVFAGLALSTLPAQAIVGGDFLRPNADGSSPYPWFASLFYSDPRAVTSRSKRDSFCGGALIGRKYVITASHCVNGMRQNKEITDPGEDPKLRYSEVLHVRVGHTNRNPDDPSSGSTGIVRKVVRLHMSEDYTDDIFDGGDYAILELEEPVPGTDEAPLTGIDPVEIANEMPADRTRLYALGHGISRFYTNGKKDYGTTTDRTKIASYLYRTNRECAEEERRLDMELLKPDQPVEDVADYEDDIADDNYCGYIDNIRQDSSSEHDVDTYPDPGTTCQGDSGGPHFYLANGEPKLLGVTSYGIGAGCIGPQFNVRLGWRDSDDPDEPSSVQQWINAVLAGENPFIIGAEEDESHFITITGAKHGARDFRGHAGYIMGRTPGQKGYGSDYLYLEGTGALTFDISNIDKIRVDGYYWELPQHKTLIVPHLDSDGNPVESEEPLDVEIENGLFAVNGILVADLNTERLNRTKEMETYGFIDVDKDEEYDVWNKRAYSYENDEKVFTESPHAEDEGDWYLAEQQVRNNPALSGEGTVRGTVKIDGGGLHTPGHRNCVLKATMNLKSKDSTRCFLPDDITEYMAHKENLFGSFTVEADENFPQDDENIYRIKEGGVLLADIHPDGRHDQVRVVGGNASIEGTLVGLFHEGKYGEFAYYPLVQTDPDKAIVDEDGEGIDWDKIVMQGAGAYYESDGDQRALPKSLSDFRVVRLRTTTRPQEGGDKTHISDGFFLWQKNSPFAGFADDSPFAAVLDTERERLGIENFEQPEDEDYFEVDADFVKENRQMWSLLNGMSIDASRKLRQLGSSSSLAAASLAGQVLSGAHANSVHQRMSAALSGDGFELAENRKNQYSAVADFLSFWSGGGAVSALASAPGVFEGPVSAMDGTSGQRMDFGRELGSGLDDQAVGMWSQVFHTRGRIDNGGEPDIRRRGSGITFGIDMPIAKGALLGISGGYSREKYTNGIGVGSGLATSAESEMDMYNVGLYGGLRNGAFRLSGDVRYGRGDIRSVRPLDILPGETGLASAKFGGTYWHGSLEAGWRFDLDAPALDDVENGRLTLEPFAGVEMLHQSYDGFRETGYGDGLLDVSVAPNDQFGVTGSLGAKFTYSYLHEQSMIDASLSAYWNGELHREGRDTASLTYDFLAGHGAIATGDDLANIGKSATVIRTGFRFRPLREGLPVLSFSYDARIRDGLQSGTVSGQLSWKF